MGFEVTQTYNFTFVCIISRWLAIRVAMSAYDHS